MCIRTPTGRAMSQCRTTKKDLGTGLLRKLLKQTDLTD